MYEAPNEFSQDEIKVLSPYFTNMDRTVFVLKNLPEVVKGALFSRYSRTDKSLRRVLLDEFIREPEMGFSEIVNHARANGEDSIIATQKAEEFYNRVLVGYGDDSVEELGGAHIACEFVSRPVIKLVEDCRIGASPLEKSSRYVYFDQKVWGQFLYYRDPDLLNSRYGKQYISAMDNLFVTYSSLIGPLRTYYQKRFPKQLDESDRAYNSTIRAKVCDTLRGLLPLGVYGNVGIFANGRAFRYMITKLLASEFSEARELGQVMHRELAKVIPSFVRRANDEKYGQPTIDYIQKNRSQVRQVVNRHAQGIEPDFIDDEQVKLIDYDPDAVLRILAVIIFSESHLSLSQAKIVATRLAPPERKELLDVYFSHRQNRFHKPGRALENTSYTFDIIGDYAAYYDLQRHRTLTQQRQVMTPYYGITVPAEIIETGLAETYRAAMSQAVDCYAKIEEDFPIQAQYLIPQAHRLRWYFTLNFRELVHIAELRTSPQGHPNYRRLTQKLYREVEKVHPELTRYISYINLEESVGLERREAEKRLDQKIKLFKTKKKAARQNV